MSNKENTKDSSKELITIQILDSKNNPINNAKITLLAMGQKILLDTSTDSNGKAPFNSKPYLKDINRFEITINHPDYYSYPINRNRKICRSYEYGHLCVERFEKIPAFYFNGKTLSISQYPNYAKKYALKNPPTIVSNNQIQNEYYIQLQENQKSLKIYKDENLTQESGYTLYLGTQNTQAESTQSQSNTTTILNFESKESLKQFTNDTQEIIIKDKKKGNISLVHRFVIDGEREALGNAISLYFNGKLLTILINKNSIEIERVSFHAVSGRPQEKSDDKHYFTYEKERQMLKSEGPIPEGEYYIDINRISEVPAYRLDRQYGWGEKNVPIELNNQETYGRYGFYIHGGWSAGSAGCIDLWDKNELFFEKLIKLSNKFNVNRIPLVVEYKDSIMECSKNLLGLIKQCEAKQ